MSRLLVILPHSNIEKAVGAIQERIFGRFGITSAIALPPVVPLRFVSSPGKVHPPRGITVHSTEYEIDAGSLYLGVELRAGGEKLQTGDITDAVGKRQPNAPGRLAAPFPDHTGFYLCTADDAELLAAVVKDISPPPGLNFHPLGVALLTLKYPAAGPWWSHLSWEIGPLEKIRKQRDPSHGSRAGQNKA